MKPTYIWHKHARVPKDADPQTVGEHIAQLRGSTFGSLPEAVVKDAEREDSPLHPYFEWDDSKAAYQHRMHQARQIIAWVRYAPSGKDKEPRRVFVNIKTYDEEEDESTNEYMVRAKILGDDDLRRRAELQTLDRMYAVGEDMSDLPAVARVLKLIDVERVNLRVATEAA